MALGCSENAYIFLNISYGKITQRTNEGVPDAKGRILTKGPNAGKTVFEKQFDYIEANLNDFDLRESEYGEKLNLILQDEDKTYILDVPFSSKIASIFFTRLPNINPNLPLKMSVFTVKKDDNTEVTMCAFFQANKKIEAFYTKENPKEMPPLKVVERRGKKEYDNTEILLWQEGLIDKYSPLFRAAAERRGGTVDYDKTAVPKEDEDEELPF